MHETNVVVKEGTKPDSVLDTGHTASVTDSAVDESGKRLASCSVDGSIRIFAVDSEISSTIWKRIAVLEGHTGPVVRVAWAPSAHYPSALLSCGEDCQVMLWRDFGDVKRWAKVYSTTLSSSPWCIAWAPPEYGKMFAVGCASGSVEVFLGDEQLWHQKSFNAHSNGCCSISWAPAVPPGALLTAPLESELQDSPSPTPREIPISPPRLATCGGERVVLVWTLCGEEWRPHELPVNVEASWREVAWAPGTGMPFVYIAAGSAEGFVEIWSQDGPARGEWNYVVLPQQDDRVTKLSWSLVGTFLLVSFANGTASMWQESASSGGWEQVCEMMAPVVD